MQNNLTFLRVSESNIDQFALGLSELHLSARSQTRDPAFWQWCYFNNPPGKSNLIVAIRDGQIVGK